MHKTKQGALKAARDAMGEHAIEGVDFNLKNTGAGWSFEEIPAGNEAASERKAAKAEKKAQASAKPKGVKAPKEVVAASNGRGPTKGDSILAMLRAPGGATSKAMEKATGWKPHSVRGFLGTLRSKGVKVISTKEPKQPTVYSVAEVGDVV